MKSPLWKIHDSINTAAEEIVKEQTGDKSPANSDKLIDEKAIIKLDSLIKKYTVIEKQLEKIKVAVLDGKDSRAELMEFYMNNEGAFLDAKGLSYLLDEEDEYKLSPEEKREYLGTWKDKRFFIRKIDSGYELILPPVNSKQVKDCRGREGRAVYYLVDKLLHDEEKKNRLELYEKASITFIHVFKNDDKALRAYDADNVDTKRIIDALKQKIIVDDSIWHVELHHLFEIGNWSHTKVVIKGIIHG